MINMTLLFSSTASVALTCASWAQGFVPPDIPNILDNRVAIAKCPTRDVISKLHVTSLLGAASIEVVETTSVVTSFYVLRPDEQFARRLLASDTELGRYVFDAEPAPGTPVSGLARYRILDAVHLDRMGPRLARLNMTIRKGLVELEPTIGTIEVIAFHTRNYLHSVFKRGKGYDCRVGYNPKGGGHFRWIVFQVLDDWTIVGLRHGLI
jgi:hypothetical protein